jgi:hypothetical protein
MNHFTRPQRPSSTKVKKIIQISYFTWWRLPDDYEPLHPTTETLTYQRLSCHIDRFRRLSQILSLPFILAQWNVFHFLSDQTHHRSLAKYGKLSSLIFLSLHMSRLKFFYRRSHNHHLQSPTIQTIPLAPGKKTGQKAIEPWISSLPDKIWRQFSHGDGYPTVVNHFTWPDIPSVMKYSHFRWSPLRHTCERPHSNTAFVLRMRRWRPHSDLLIGLLKH